MQSPTPFLVAAQQSIARRDFAAAADIFTRMIDAFPSINKQLPLLSRSTCFMELKRWEEALDDALQ
ncbi:hypothetical protein HK102_011444, partial [Quaeritorhiza haematococci]